MARHFVVGFHYRESIMSGEEHVYPAFGLLVRAGTPEAALSHAFGIWGCEWRVELIATTNGCFYHSIGENDFIRFQIEAWAKSFLEMKSTQRQWHYRYLVVRPEPLDERSVTRAFIVRSEKQAYLVAPGLHRAFVVDRLNLLSFCSADSDRDVSALLGPRNVIDWSGGAIIAICSGGSRFQVLASELWEKLVRHLKINKAAKPALRIVKSMHKD